MLIKYNILLLLLVAIILNCKAQLRTSPEILNFDNIDFDSLKNYRQEVVLENTGLDSLDIRYVNYAPEGPAIVSPYPDCNCYNPDYKYSFNVRRDETISFKLAPGEQRVAYVFINPNRSLLLEEWRWRSDNRLGIYAGSRNGPIHVNVHVHYTLKPALIWTDDTQNLGRYKQGDTVRVEFHYINTTGRTLSFIQKEGYAYTDYTWVKYNDTILPYSQGALTVLIYTKRCWDSIDNPLYIEEANAWDVPYCFHYKLIVDKVKYSPHIEFEKTRIYKEIAKGDESSACYYFNFKNTGTSPVIVYSCRSSSGSVVPIAPVDPIEPGQSGTIVGHYDVNCTGRFTKTMVVSTNDRYEKNTTLFLTGVVFPK